MYFSLPQPVKTNVVYSENGVTTMELLNEIDPLLNVALLYILFLTTINTYVILAYCLFLINFTCRHRYDQCSTTLKLVYSVSHNLSVDS